MEVCLDPDVPCWDIELLWNSAAQNEGGPILSLYQKVIFLKGYSRKDEVFSLYTLLKKLKSALCFPQMLICILHPDLCSARQDNGDGKHRTDFLVA